MEYNRGQDRLLSRYLDHTLPNSHSALSIPHSNSLYQITTYGFANNERSGFLVEVFIWSYLNKSE